MEKKEFDKKVQELLTDFKENYDPQSWDSFEEKLSMEEELDSLIKNSVEDHKEPFNEHHWELLTEEIQRRKIRTIIKRSAEVLIILLLILTTQNFLQLKNSINSNSREKVIIAQLDFDIPQLRNQVSFDVSQLMDLSNGVNVELNLSNTLPFDFALNSSSKFLKEKSFVSLSAEFVDAIIRKSALIEEDVYNESQTFVTNEPLSNSDVNSLIEDQITTDVERIAALGISNLDLYEKSLALSSTESFAPNQYKENGLWFSVLAGADVNFINSPFDLSLLRNPIQTQSGTLSLGATISKDIGNFELMTGLIYSNKKYYPYRIREFVPSINQKYLETSLRSLEFDQIQVPLLVHYHSPRMNGLSVYGTLGLGVNVITNTFYDVETQVRSFNSAPSNSKGVESLNLRELPRGAFQSGSYGDNVYTSGIVGFGIEKRFNNLYAFSILTSYQRSISKEINTIINRTQQLGVSTSLKVNLK
jgi:hypothetical protein